MLRRCVLLFSLGLGLVLTVYVSSLPRVWRRCVLLFSLGLGFSFDSIRRVLTESVEVEAVRSRYVKFRLRV